MPKAKLFLYKAASANVVAILRRDTSDRDNWELIKWDLDTDRFTEGQWLLKKHMNGASSCAISPDGQLFGYHYEVYNRYVKGKRVLESVGVISKLPNFTALYINKAWGFNWFSVMFDQDGSVIGYKEQWEKKGNIDLHFVTGDIRRVASGYIETNENEWIDPKGRKITTKEGKLYADDQLLYDTTDHMFVEREAI